jgi:hypothetical protein
MDETKKSFNVNYKKIEDLFFEEVFELIKKSGNEKKTLDNIEKNMEEFKKSIIAAYEKFENTPKVESEPKIKHKKNTVKIDASISTMNIVL